jgi:hypothetical protein
MPPYRPTSLREPNEVAPQLSGQASATDWLRKRATESDKVLLGPTHVFELAGSSRADLHHRTSTRPSSRRDPPSRELSDRALTRMDERSFARNFNLTQGQRTVLGDFSHHGQKSPSANRVLLRALTS